MRDSAGQVAVAAVQLSRMKILRPLGIRDFALLWGGMTVSFLGDGLYTVAIAWQVYAISNVPTALALVGVAWMVPQVLLLLVGGAVSDRFERRRVLILSDAIRGSAIAAIGMLSVSGTLQLWHVIALVAVYGAGGAVFTPVVHRDRPRRRPARPPARGELARPVRPPALRPARRACDRRGPDRRRGRRERRSSPTQARSRSPRRPSC